jgi:hypothetical protein
VIRADGDFGREYTAAEVVEFICNRPADGLHRCAIDGDHCVGQGPTWDLIARDFS